MTLSNGFNETLRCPVLRINEHDVLWVAARRIDGEENNRPFQDLGLRVYRSAFEKEQFAGAELDSGTFIFHPECASARGHIEVFVTSRMVVRRGWLINPKDACAGRFAIGKVMIHEQRGGSLG